MNDGNLATIAFASVDFPEPDDRQQAIPLGGGPETTRNTARHNHNAAIIRI